MFVQSGRKTGVSPWLLAAMAIRESALNPYAEGKGGERGILQIHPKRRDARKLRWMRDPAYREHCKRKLGACQAEIVDHAAAILRRAIQKCGGDTAQGLAMYNAGRCNAATSYPYRVHGELGRLYEFGRSS
jgi:hypothetical protein